MRLRRPELVVGTKGDKSLDLVEGARRRSEPTFVVEKYLQPEDWNHFLEYLTQKKRDKAWFQFAEAAFGLSILYPERRDELGLDEEAWEGMRGAMEAERAASATPKHFHKEFGLPMKMLYPKKVSELNLNAAIWERTKNHVETERMRRFNRTSDVFLSAAFAARMLFPDRAQELDLNDPELKAWAVKEYTEGQGHLQTKSVLMLKLLFPDVIGELPLPSDFWQKRIDWIPKARNSKLWHQLIPEAAYMKLIAENVQITSDGFLKPAQTSAVYNQSDLPERLEI